MAKSKNKTIKKSESGSIWHKDLRFSGTLIFLVFSILIIGLVVYAISSVESLDTRSQAASLPTGYSPSLKSFLNKYPPPKDQSVCPVDMTTLKKILKNNPNVNNNNSTDNIPEPNGTGHPRRGVAKQITGCIPNCRYVIAYEVKPPEGICISQVPYWKKVCKPTPTYKSGDRRALFCN